MSELPKDSGRRLVALLERPLPQHAEAAAAWERGESVEYRYVGLPADFVGNEWRDCGPHEGHDFHLGGHYINTPNWQADRLEFRAVKGAK